MTLEQITEFARMVADDPTLDLEVRYAAEELAELAAGTKAPWANARVEVSR